jgi:hypothetical protein
MMTLPISRTQDCKLLVAVDDSDEGVEVVNQISQFVETEGADISVVLSSRSTQPSHAKV